MSFSWQIGELFVGLTVTLILTTRHRQGWPFVNRVVALLKSRLLFPVLAPPLLIICFLPCLGLRLVRLPAL